MIIDAQRIILINGSRLLTDMLHHVICKVDHLEIVQEVSWYAELPAVIDGTDADWVLMSPPFDTSFPTWVDDHIATHPYVRFLGIFISSGKVRIKSLNESEQQLEGLSLNDLINILETHPQQIHEK